MNSTEDKKNFFYMTVLILTLISVIVGAAFAIYTFLHSQKEGSSTVYTGTLSIEYLEGNIIYLHDIYPTSKPNIETTENVYRNTFKVTNTGTLSGKLSLYLDISKNTFSEGALKYRLFNSEGEEITTGDVPKDTSSEIASNILLPKESEAEYTIIIWLGETGINQNEEMRKVLTGSIRANADQIRE